MPYLYEIYFTTFVKLRAKEENQMGATKKGRQSEPASKVAHRHLTTKTGTCFYKPGAEDFLISERKNQRASSSEIKLAFNRL
jgi:hypothetical protein